MSAQRCQPARRAITPPKVKAPPGAADCHFHIFGPDAGYPYAEPRGYTPPEALIPQYEAMIAMLGIERMVIVHPSVYGTDNRCSLDAMAAFGSDRCRMVAVLNEHLQVYVEGEQLDELAPVLARLPVPVVVDHMGQIMTGLGVNHPAVAALRRLIDSGRGWVKLCGYRCSSAGYPYRDVTPLARALIGAAAERCLWGTDWPHPNIEGTMPDDGELLDLLTEWAPTAAIRHRILVENPAELYDFPR
ncbi:MAG TPA: amidohydrolase family protein [Stellaceae bacterium]|nr:amidohydrolase family protein [Stellaceae bacterium]